MAVMAIAPAALIARNQKAGNGAVVSTNINAALSYGTGDDTLGGYARTGDYISCGDKKINELSNGGEVIKCAAKWYLSNPLKTAQLSWNKSVYFWSPWSGPSANGTMARNPWLKINPITDIAKGSQQGRDLVYGSFGKLISWAFIALSLFFLFFGFVAMRRLGSSEKFLANILLVPVMVSWVNAVVTLGDHRFRIPTMSLSLVLQIWGMIALRKAIKSRSVK
jgi:hypothetical protein